MRRAPASGRARGGLASFVVAAALVPALAQPAWALCPNCLGQNAILSPTMRIVGVFLLVPPAVFFFVARVVSRLSR